jgi:hypothetical protein
MVDVEKRNLRLVLVCNICRFVNFPFPALAPKVASRPLSRDFSSDVLLMFSCPVASRRVPVCLDETGLQE